MAVLGTAAGDSGLGWFVTLVAVVGAAKLFRRKRRDPPVDASPLALPRPATPPETRPPAAELAIAGQRMRHLAALGIKPLPPMHSADGRPLGTALPAQDERREELAFHVLAVQMWHAGAQSALPRSEDSPRHVRRRRQVALESFDAGRAVPSLATPYSPRMTRHGGRRSHLVAMPEVDLGAWAPRAAHSQAANGIPSYPAIKAPDTELAWINPADRVKPGRSSGAGKGYGMVRWGDRIAIACVALGAVALAANQAITDNLIVVDHIPPFMTTPLWSYVPLILVGLAGVSWAIAHSLAMIFAPPAPSSRTLSPEPLMLVHKVTSKIVPPSLSPRELPQVALPSLEIAPSLPTSPPEPPRADAVSSPPVASERAPELTPFPLPHEASTTSERTASEKTAAPPPDPQPRRSAVVAPRRILSASPVPPSERHFVDLSFEHLADWNKRFTKSEVQDLTGNFVGKWTRISGTLDHVRARADSEFARVTFSPEQQARVMMFFASKWIERLNALNPGTPMTVIGEIDTIRPWGVALKDCEVLNN